MRLDRRERKEEGRDLRKRSMIEIQSLVTTGMTAKIEDGDKNADAILAEKSPKLSDSSECEKQWSAIILALGFDASRQTME